MSPAVQDNQYCSMVCVSNRNNCFPELIWPCEVHRWAISEHYSVLWCWAMASLVVESQTAVANKRPIEELLAS